MGDAVGEYILFPHGVFLWPDSGLTQNFEQEEGIAVPEGQVSGSMRRKALVSSSRMVERIFSSITQRFKGMDLSP